MNVSGGLDFSGLDDRERDYLDAVGRDLLSYRFLR
jgi:hypothetical protein